MAGRKTQCVRRKQTSCHTLKLSTSKLSTSKLSTSKLSTSKPPGYPGWQLTKLQRSLASADQHRQRLGTEYVVLPDLRPLVAGGLAIVRCPAWQVAPVGI